MFFSYFFTITLLCKKCIKQPSVCVVSTCLYCTNAAARVVAGSLARIITNQFRKPVIEKKNIAALSQIPEIQIFQRMKGMSK